MPKKEKDYVDEFEEKVENTRKNREDVHDSFLEDKARSIYFDDDED